MAKDFSLDEYPIERRSAGVVLSDKARKLGNRDFIYFKDEKISFEGLNRNANRIGNALTKLGIDRGGKVCVMMTSKPAYLYLWFGLSKIGAVEVPINVAYKGELLQYIINSCDAETIVSDEVFLEPIVSIKEELKNVKRLILFSEDSDKEISNPTNFELIPFEQLLRGAETDPTIELDWGELICILYTSGTTGLSKGAMLAVNGIYRAATGHAEIMRYNPEDVVYNYLPFFHAAAKFVTFAALLAECQMVLQERFSVNSFWPDAKKYGVTAFLSVGGIMHMLHGQAKREGDGDNPIEKGYCIPIPVEIYEGFMERFNIGKLQEAYGQTESGLIVSTPWDEPWREGSSGKSSDPFEVIIADEQGRELPRGEQGEVLVRSKEPYTMMLGYYKMPEETIQAFRNFWFHTGDRGYMDEEGWFYFVDRMKDTIRRRGENISSFEVERVVNRHPKVAESAVFAVGAKVGEDEVMASVVLNKGEKMEPEELIAFCEERMAYFAVPRYVEFRETLPKTPTQKIEKYKLKNDGVTPNTWDREKSGYKLKR